MRMSRRLERKRGSKFSATPYLWCELWQEAKDPKKPILSVAFQENRA